LSGNFWNSLGNRAPEMASHLFSRPRPLRTKVLANAGRGEYRAARPVWDILPGLREQDSRGYGTSGLETTVDGGQHTGVTDAMRSSCKSQRLGRRRATAKAGTALAVVLAVVGGSAGVAFANAANPLPDSKGTAVASGTIVHNADGSFTVQSGTVGVQVGGTWDWGTLSGSSPQSSCATRYGVGWAVDWAGMSTSASAPGSVGSLQVRGTGEFFHVFESDMHAVPPAPNGNSYPFTSPCQQVDAQGFPMGPWSAVHTYASGSTIPRALCVNMYDLHGTPGSIKAGDFSPVGNHDNSIQTNSFNPNQGQGYCFAPHFLNAPTITTSATDAAVGSAITDKATLSGATSSAGGSITFTAYSDAGCTTKVFTSSPVAVHGDGTYGPVSFTPASAGSYRWIAAYSGDGNTAGVSGACGDTGETSTVSPAPPPTPQTQTIAGTIVDCASGAQVDGGSLVASLNGTTVATADNQLPATQVAAGTYTLSATAPAGDKFVGCVPNSPVVIASQTSANQPVVVPEGGSGTGTFYVAPLAPKSQTLAGAILDCATGAPVDGGSLVASLNGTTVATADNQLSPTAVQAPGTYTLSATAPAGDKFVSCVPNSPVIIASQTSASQPVVVPAGGSGTGTFYVSPITPQGQTIAGTIVDCASGAPVDGGSLVASLNGTTVATADNQLPATQVQAGTFTLSASAPAGDKFVSCVPNSPVIIASQTSASQPVVVPAGGSGTGTFYVSPIKENKDQTIAGTIVDCASGAPVDGGSLVASLNGTTVATADNQLPATKVKSGTYTLSATAPAGDQFVACVPNSPVVIASQTSASQPVVVPEGGSGTGTFFVSAIPAPQPPANPPLSITVVKTNDANGSGTFSQDETGTVAGADVPFRATVTNTSTVPVVVDSLTDSWPGMAPFSPTCAKTVVGTTLAPGASATCDFSVAGAVPTAGSLTDTVVAAVHQENKPDNKADNQAISKVNAPPIVLASTVTRAPAPAPAAPAPAPAAVSPATAARAPAPLARTGPGHAMGLFRLALLLLFAGFGLLWLTRQPSLTVPGMAHRRSRRLPDQR